MPRDYVTDETLNPCPCCGYRVFQYLGAAEDCPICQWEDWWEQLKDPFLVCAPNGISLYEGQKHFLAFGASQPSRRSAANIPKPTDIRDQFWRPIHTTDDFGTQARRAKIKDPKKGEYSRLYYWTCHFWNAKTSYQRTD